MDGLLFLVMTGIVLALVYLVQAVPIDIAKESPSTESTTRGDIPDNTPNQIGNIELMAWQTDTTHISTTKNSSDEAFQGRHPLMVNEETTTTEGLQSEDTVSIRKPGVKTKGTASKYSMQTGEENLKIESTSEENITRDSVTVTDAKRQSEESNTLEERQKQAEGTTSELVEVNPEDATTLEESADETKFIVDLQEINSNGTRGRINLPFRGISSTQSNNLVTIATLTSGKEQSRETSNNDISKDDLSEEESIAAYLKVDYAGAAMKKDDLFEGKSTTNTNDLNADVAETIKENITEVTSTENNKLINEVGPFKAMNEYEHGLDDEDCLFDHQRFDVDAIGNTTNKNLFAGKNGIEPSKVDTEKSQNTTENPLKENPLDFFTVNSSQSSTDPSTSTSTSAQYNLHTAETETSEIQLGNEERRHMLVILHKAVYDILQNLQEHGENGSSLVSGAQSDKSSGNSASVQPQINESSKDVDWNLILRALSQTLSNNYNVQDLKNVIATQQSGDKEDEGLNN